ncbi:MAG: hypothetical protein U1E23_11185 [Reyranellaceae bacterium]
MMTQPIRTFNELSSELTAGRNAKDLSFEDRRRIEMRARTARAEVLAEGISDAILWCARQWRRLVGAAKADLKLRAAEAQLYRMTDRELADLGLARSDIHFAVRDAAQGVTPALDAYDGALAAANQNLRHAA